VPVIWLRNAGLPVTACLMTCGRKPRSLQLSSAHLNRILHLRHALHTRGWRYDSRDQPVAACVTGEPCPTWKPPAKCVADAFWTSSRDTDEPTGTPVISHERFDGGSTARTLPPRRAQVEPTLEAEGMRTVTTSPTERESSSAGAGVIAGTTCRHEGLLAATLLACLGPRASSVMNNRNSSVSRGGLAAEFFEGAE
jgi:hypothetical protein